MLTREIVTWGYRLILGREPESDDAIQSHLGHDSIDVFRGVLLSSREFERKNHLTHGINRWVASPIFEGKRLIWLNLADRFVSRGCLLDFYEPAETHFVRSLLRRNDIFLDIGANIGWFTLIASTIIDVHGHIYAFEPRGETRLYLEKTVAMNGLSGTVTVYPFALSDSRGEGLLSWSIETDNPGGSFLSPEGRVGMEQQRVELLQLDELGLGRINFIKLDVEGAEMRVLRGAQRTVSEHRPILLSELSPSMLSRVSGAPVEEFFEYFHHLEYAAFIVDMSRFGERIETFPRDWPKSLLNVGLIPNERSASIDMAIIAQQLVEPITD
jgi:FkbM family methyltransferase